MSHLSIYLLALAALSPARPALALGGGLQDLAAYPKHQVDFLNDLPLAESDAAAIRQYGLTHEDQFLERHPGRKSWSPERGTIDGGVVGDGGVQGQLDGVGTIEDETRLAPREADHVPGASTADARRIKLMPMLYTHPGEAGEYGPHSYLCALPSENTTASQTVGFEETVDEPEPDPEASWRALSHLDNQCLYLRLPHSWFTYAYCHNKDIRQFHEKQIPHPHPEGFVPKEDTDYDAYTLGVAHPKKDMDKKDKKKKKKNELQRPEDVAPEQTATFGKSHASRYLVQKWTDGTRCDLTGKPREIEVQVYCSMTATDMIYLVNEVAICSYVMVIHSPHLCSLPGFRPTTAIDIKPAPIRCREVVPDDEFAEWANKAEERRLRLGEKEKDEPALDVRLASEEEDPELKIQGLGGINQDAIKAILEAAFGGISGKTADELVLEGEPEPAPVGTPAEATKKGAAGVRADADADAGAGAGADAKDELYFVEWNEDTDGNRVPVDVGSVPPTEGESRRAFLERLHALIEKELKGGEAKAESEPKADKASPDDPPAKQRDEL